MTKIEVATRVGFNDTGRWGAGFFIGSPLVASAVLYPLLGRALASSSAADLLLLGFGFLACGVAFFFGIVMMVVGREYHHKVEIQRE